ncbi:MAG: hypothetical protein HQM02_14210 [Magnetococcales bacterium]|nr:hypothetical protein [Magnetococcales bacterium]
MRDASTFLKFSLNDPSNGDKMTASQRALPAGAGATVAVPCEKCVLDMLFLEIFLMTGYPS